MVSLAVHAAAIALVISGVTRRWTRTPAPGPIAIVLPDVGGGGGGSNREAYISPPTAPTQPRVRERPPPPPPPVEAAPIESPVVVPPPEPAADTQAAVSGSVTDTILAAVPGPGAGPGAGAGTGGGEGGGTGGGIGPGTGAGQAGEGGRGRAPEPRQLVIPPADFPKELRGRRIEVTFFVAADGRVEHVEVAPAIAHGGFARKFEETMRSYRFRPARSPAGTPIAGSTTITVSF
jgi:protein TonB